MNLKLLTFVLSAFLLASCQSTQKISTEDTPIDRAHTSENALDWDGTYQGLLPCADCPGIATQLVLNKDFTYKLSMDYQERETKYQESGTFKWNTEGTKITLYKNKEEPSSSYFVGENKLFQLDSNGHRIKGEISDKFILEKQLKN